MHTVTTPTSPTAAVMKLAWPLVALTAILALLVVGLYFLAPPDAKPPLTPLFALFGNIPGAVAAYAAYLQSKRNAQVVNYHGAVLGKIDKQTNGQLDERIVTAVGQAIDQRPTLFTDAAVAQGISTLLERHLEAASSAVSSPGAPATVSTVTTIAPAVDPTPTPAAAPEGVEGQG